MEKRTNKIIIVLVFFVIVLLGVSFYFMPKAVVVKNFDVKFIVGESYGFDLNSSVLAFGMIIPGGNMNRNIEIRNNQNFPVEVRVFASDNIVNFLVVNSNFTLGSKENMTLPVALNVPKDTPYGDYSGKFRIEFHKIAE